MFTKVEPKSCPHCGGAMALREDLDGPYWTCLQCSRTLNPSLPPSLGLKLTRAMIERAA